MAIALPPLKEYETFGSNFGRYAELMGLKSTSRLRQSLFGYYSEPGSRLPMAIDYLAEQARDYWSLEAKDVVKGHTEFQYVTMMASQSMREKILQAMLASPADGRFRFPHRILGLKGERTATLRYCEGCLTESMETQEAPYWRIDHQLAGVYCCVKHGLILKSVKRVLSERYFDQTVLRLINTSDERVLRQITPSERKAIDDVAKKSGLQLADGMNRRSIKMYRDMLEEAGFLRADSRINHRAITTAWFCYFGKEYCHVTNMSAGRISKWLQRFTDQAVRCECPHPFMFIAGESFLEHHIELPGSYFPQTNWKVQNFASGREMAAPVWEAHLCKGALHRSADVLEFTSLRQGRWKLVCTCGVSYRVRNATQCDAAQLVPISYGDRYRKRCIALIAKGASVGDAARKLQLSNATVSNWSYGEGVGNIKLLPRREIRGLRATWRRLVNNASPERRITAAIEADPAVHRALLKNDLDWLRTFNRSHRSPGRTKGAVRLKQPTSDQIREAFHGLISTEPPIRATRGAIIERAGFCRVSSWNGPSESALAELVESRPAYLERVISWLVTLASEQRLGDCEEAIRTAGLRRSRFSSEQRERIRAIEFMSSADG